MSTGAAIALAGAGSLLLAAAVAARRARLIVWGLAALGFTAALEVSGGRGSGVGVATPLAAAALLALGEAAFYGAERAAGTEYTLRRASRVVLAMLSGLAVSAAVLLAAQIGVRSSLALTLGGTLAAVIAIALPGLGFQRRGKPADQGLQRPPRRA